MKTPTLAAKLGTTAHISALLIKAKRLGLDAEGLDRLAVQRGCFYYHDGSPLSPATVTREQFSDAELAIALLNPALRYSPHSIRLGAAMLSTADNTAEEIARRAIWERCESVVRYIAKAGHKYEPENPFWVESLSLLPQHAPPKDGAMPHPTRFIEMTGMIRSKVGFFTQWVRPQAGIV